MKKNRIPSTLVYVNDDREGYTRAGEKKNFRYLQKNGSEITDPEVIERITSLVIPPDWKNVWICKNPKGHIQATGRDSKGRKQYIYHEEWVNYINHEKYNGLRDFGKKLPDIRKQLAKDLRKRTWNKRKVVALAVKLLDEAYLRVGNKFYMQANGTYGLTTLRKKHLSEDKKNLLLKFQAKNGKLRQVKISHPTLRRLLRESSELPGYEVFRYRENGKFLPINSQDINEYLHEVSGSDITAKDFRTWGGTVFTIKFAPEAEKICDENPRKKLETTLVRLVAKKLNNTVTVARKYYIHPGVLKKAVDGTYKNYEPKRKSKRLKIYDPEEITVLNILQEE